jgi:hypothetical protein
MSKEISLTEFESKYGKIPEHLDKEKISKLLTKSINKYNLIDDVYSDVINWLKSENFDFTEELIEYKNLKKDSQYLKSININNKLIIIVVDNYSEFNKKVCSKNIAKEIHDEILAKGVRIVWCKKFEWENLQKQKVMKSLIMHSLGKTKQRYYARKTEAIVYENKNLKEFLDEASFYGFRSAKYCVALKDKATDKILMTLTFGHPYYANNKDKDKKVLECIRSSTIPNTIIVGGMSKLMKFFVNTFADEFDEIIFYCDDAHHQSSSMSSIGFKYSHRTDNGVHNVFSETGAMMMRTPALHKEIKWCQEIGFIIGIPDVGNTTHIYCKGNDIGNETDLIL